jgi:hypothetical protein
VWIKDRANANNHQLIDSVRGTTAVLQSNTDAVETTYSAPSGTSVAWIWKANGTGVSNTAGDISSTVSANTDAGFSIVTYTGNGGTNASVGHGLGVAPKVTMVKRRTGGAADWVFYTTAIDGSQDFSSLNATTAFGNAGSSAPTSSLIYLGGSVSDNANGSTYVAYCFAEVEGFSKINTYLGNGSADGPFIYCGFRPKFILSRATAGDFWRLTDAERNTFNVVGEELYPNATNAGSSALLLDFTANGYKVRTNLSAYNGSGSRYLFMAFAESPFNYSRAR